MTYPGADAGFWNWGGGGNLLGFYAKGGMGRPSVGPNVKKPTKGGGQTPLDPPRSATEMGRIHEMQNSFMYVKFK